jgi:hypothetical protein
MESLTAMIENSFEKWAGNENGFSRDVLVPLLTRMKLEDPRFTGGTGEKGIDVLYHETFVPESMPRFSGIQVKLGDITARTSGGITPSSLEPQIRQAFEKEVGLRGSKAFTRISTLIICTTGNITPEAREEIEKGTHGDRRLGAPIRFWEGSDIAAFIEKYWLEGYAQLTGLTLPAGFQQVVVQGDSLAVGVALAKAGHNQPAIELLEPSLRSAAFWLSSALLAQDTDFEAMLRAAKALVEFDDQHFNQYWIAGYASFRLGRYAEADRFLSDAIRMLQGDKSEEVQRGAGYQERYLQAIGMRLEIARHTNNAEAIDALNVQYREKFQFLVADLGSTPSVKGEWEKDLRAQLKITPPPAAAAGTAPDGPRL